MTRRYCGRVGAVFVLRTDGSRVCAAKWREAVS